MRRNSLDAIVPRILQRILAAAFMAPEKAWYRAELAQHLGLPPSSLQRPLQSLAASGILTTRKDGNRLYFQANLESPLAPEIRGLMAKTLGLLDVLKEALEPLERDVLVAFVYGSIARGEERAQSDVDLLVVGTASPYRLTTALSQAERRLGRPVNPTVFGLEEFRKKSRGHFLREVLDKEKLFVVGTFHDLEAALGGGARRPAQDKRERD